MLTGYFSMVVTSLLFELNTRLLMVILSWRGEIGAINKKRKIGDSLQCTTMPLMHTSWEEVFEI